MARIRIKTYGCTHNQADSQQMGGLLEAAGHQVVERGEELLLVNSCAVKDPSEQKFYHDIRSARTPVVLAGCVIQGNREDEFLKGFSAVGTKDIDRIVEVVAATLAGKTERRVTRRKNSSLALPRLRGKRLVEIVPINSGCLSSCTYCKTIHARGRLESYPIAEVVTAIETARDSGMKEVWLTSEDVGAYGVDIGESIVSLLEAIAAIRGDFIVRVGMANPQHIIKHIDQMLALFKAHPERFYHFLHVPVQSGSDKVLEQMERGYDAATFKDIVRRAKERLPGISLMTDIIVGYPTETEDDFTATLRLVEESNCRFVNISKFYARPGTRAARLKLLPTKEVARRSRALTALFERENGNESAAGKIVEAFFSERNARGQLVGHTQGYVQVILEQGGEAGEGANEKGEKREREEGRRTGKESEKEAKKESKKGSILGSWRKVKIIEGKKYYLLGELLDA